MKVTKYAQSCFLFQNEKIKILIDPGFLLLDEKTISEWKNPNFILVTHKHQDHFFEEAIKKIVSEKTIIYATSETAKAYPNTKFEVIKEGNTFYLDENKVEVVKSVHGYIPLLKGGKEVSEGAGYILTCNGKKIYHTGDTISFPNEYKCDIILLPFTNHGLTLSPFDAALFAKETGAKKSILMHYDNPRYQTDIEKAKEELIKNEITPIVLKIGESIEI
jgi:L-ascorbate metabolism protein UlaG (beta-lactamase superfamily)